MDQVRERELVQRARNGDEEAFRLLVEDNQRRIYSLALRYTRRHEDADEVAQETFVRAHRSLGRFRGEAGFSTWVYRIAVNCCLSHKRKQSRVNEVGNDETGNNQEHRDEKNPSPLRRAMSSQTRGLINRAMDSLSPQQRMVFVMKFLQQRTIAEIAGQIGCAEGTVKKQLFRAVGRMRERLAPLLGTEGSIR
jgi:RNA polymerase sigma-70 factor (ECF subfamily)